MSARSFDPESLLRHHDWLRALATTLVGDAGHADDVVQETWLRALLKPPRRTHDERSLRAWLAKVVRNLARSRARTVARAASRERAVARDEARESVADAVERVAAQRELVDAVMSLDELDRDIVVLRYFEGQSPPAIAVRLGLTDAAVRTRLSRSLDRLRARLDRKWNGRALWISRFAGFEGDGGTGGFGCVKAPPLVALGAAGKFAVVAAVVVAAAAWFFVARPPSPADASTPAAPLARVESEAADRSAQPSSPPSAASQRAEVEVASSAATNDAAATAAESYTLLARFVDASGAPVSGVELTVEDKHDPRRAASGADGRVRLDLAWPFRGSLVGNGELELRASGPALESLSWCAPMKGPGEQALGDVRIRPGGAIRGRVVDGAGQPLAQAWVRAVRPFESSDPLTLDEARTFGTNLGGVGSIGSGVRTGPDGAFELTGVPAMRVSVIASRIDLLSAIGPPLEVTTGGVALAGELVLEAPSDANRIAGVVLDDRDQPLREIHVRFEGGDRWRLEGRDTRTDERGRFRMLVARDASYSLIFSRAESEFDGLRVESVAAGTTDLVVRFGAQRWIEIVARTPDGATAPIGNVFTVRTDNYMLRATVEPTDHGSQRLLVPDTAFTVGVFVAGWRSEQQGPFEPSAAPERLTFELARPTGVSGRVLANGKPVVGARVHAHRAYDGASFGVSDDGFHARIDPMMWRGAETDVEGKFALELRGSGEYTVHAEADGYARAESDPIAYTDRVDVGGVVLTLERGGSIEGRVLTAEGISAKGTIVGAGCGDTHVVTFEVGDDAAFRFDDLPPGSWQVLRCEPDLLDRLTSGTYMDASADDRIVWNVDVRVGEVAHFDLDLRERVPCRLSGQLGFAGRGELVGWTCSLGTSAGYDIGNIDANGRFQLTAPQPGECSLYLFGPRGGPLRTQLAQTVRLTAGLNEWSAVLTTGNVTIENVPVLKRLRDHHQESAHYALVSRQVDGSVWSTWIFHADAGALTIADVPVGPAQLVAPPASARSWTPGDDWPVVRELTVTANAETRITLP